MSLHSLFVYVLNMHLYQYSSREFEGNTSEARVDGNVECQG